MLDSYLHVVECNYVNHFEKISSELLFQSPDNKVNVEAEHT